MRIIIWVWIKVTGLMLTGLIVTDLIDSQRLFTEKTGHGVEILKSAHTEKEVKSIFKEPFRLCLLMRLSYWPVFMLHSTSFQ